MTNECLKVDEPQYLSEEKNLIYDDALLTVFEFKLLISIFISRYGLNGNCSEALLKLFSKILPQPNRVKQNMLQETIIDLSKGYIKEVFCNRCLKSRQNSKFCLNEECVLFNKKSGIQEQEIFYFDTKKQIENILERESIALDNFVAVFFINL